jgi:hypothetical protein
MEQEYFSLTDAADYLVFPDHVVIGLAERERLSIFFKARGEELTGVTIRKPDGSEEQLSVFVPINGILKSLGPPEGKKLTASLVQVVGINSRDVRHTSGLNGPVLVASNQSLPTDNEGNIKEGYVVTGFADYLKVKPKDWLFNIDDLQKVRDPDLHEIQELGAQESVAKQVALVGVSKHEILSVQWPMPKGAPTLANLLDEIPMWIGDACTKVGRRGKGINGSHLWNPAILAVCLATKTPQKKWAAGKGALTSLIKTFFNDYAEQWDSASLDL